MPFCDKCGSRVTATDKYCFRCSNKLPPFPETIDAMTYVEDYYSTLDTKKPATKSQTKKH